MNTEQHTTLYDFLSASLRAAADRRRALTPSEEEVAADMGRYLDLELGRMVTGLEELASCRTEPGERPAFDDFLAGLRHIASELLPHLYGLFDLFLKERNYPAAPFYWVVQARTSAYIDYLLALARVHGVAFVASDSIEPALDRLESDLRQINMALLTARQ